MPRLFVDEILSIGVVPAGDNPFSTVEIFKARPGTKERREVEMNNSSETIGELVTAAIDAKARSWHMDGVDVEVPLVELRTRIRKTMPALRALERSQEPVAVAKSRIVKAEDRELLAAWDFVSLWS